MLHLFSKLSKLFNFQKSAPNGPSNPFLIQEREIKDNKVGDYSAKRWVEETYGEYAWEPKGLGKSGKFEFLGLSVKAKKIYVILAIVFLGLSALFFKSAYLQIAKGAYYKNLAEGNRIRIEPIESARGVIFDRNGEILVKNLPKFLLTVTPADLPADKNEFFDLLAQIASVLEKSSADGLSRIVPTETSGLARGLSQQEWIEKIAKTISEQKSLARERGYQSFESVPIAENFSYEAALLLKIKSAEWPGVKLKISLKRDYSHSPSLSHILGYTGKVSAEELKSRTNYFLTDYMGKAGLELSYEPILRGVYGRKQIEVDVRGHEKKIIAEEKPQDGKNLTLTIDSRLQETVEKILNGWLAKFGKKRAAAILLDPKSGEILSLVSSPVFNNKLFSQGISRKDFEKLINNSDNPLFNRAISGEYPSGSTIKPIIAACALEEKIINEYTTFLSTGGIKIGKWFFPDWKVGGHGLVNIVSALAHSVNTFFYIIGGGLPVPTQVGASQAGLPEGEGKFEGLGIEKMVDCNRQFGFGRKLRVDLPAEAEGFLPSKEWKENIKKEQWYIGDTYHFAIGQGDILVSPLQIAAATAVFANGGTLYKPHIVKDGSREKIVNQNFVSSSNLEIIKKGLRQAVLQGTAQALNNLPISAAGKTGTAEWHKNKPPHAWFTGFAPFNNPEIVVTVLVEEGGEGSGLAASIARDMLNYYFSHRLAIN